MVARAFQVVIRRWWNSDAYSKGSLKQKLVGTCARAKLKIESQFLVGPECVWASVGKGGCVERGDR